MAKYPHARQLLLPQNATQPHIHPRKAILHTAVDNAGKTTLFNWFQDPRAKGAESTFFVKMDGIIEQYMDTEVRADAQWDANVDAISIETEDDGDPSRPWTQAQLDSIIALLDWICTVHRDVARVLCPTPTGSGIGWHELYPEWNHSKHGCPGAVRENQIRTIILPALAHTPKPAPPTPLPSEDHVDYTIIDPNNGHTYLLRLGVLIFTGGSEQVPGTTMWRPNSAGMKNLVKAYGQPVQA